MTSGSGTITPITSATNGYCTLAEFKAFYTARGGTVGTDTSDDAVMTAIIEAVSRRIDDLTRRRFWFNATDETRYFTPEDGGEVDIGDMAAAPTSVSVDYEGSRSYTALLGTDYELWPANAALDGIPYNKIQIMPLSSAYFPTYRRGARVVGKFGWPAVPADIKEICEEITLNVYQSRSGQSSAGNVTVTAAGVVIRPNDIPASAMKVIEYYNKLL